MGGGEAKLTAVGAELDEKTGRRKKERNDRQQLVLGSGIEDEKKRRGEGDEEKRGRWEEWTVALVCTPNNRLRGNSSGPSPLQPPPSSSLSSSSWTSPSLPTPTSTTAISHRPLLFTTLAMSRTGEYKSWVLLHTPLCARRRLLSVADPHAPSRKHGRTVSQNNCLARDLMHTVTLLRRACEHFTANCGESSNSLAQHMYSSRGSRSPASAAALRVLESLGRVLIGSRQMEAGGLVSSSASVNTCLPNSFQRRPGSRLCVDAVHCDVSGNRSPIVVVF